MSKLSTFNNLEYNHGRSKIVRLFWIVVSGCFLETWIPYPICVKLFLLRVFGAKIGHGFVLKPNVKIKYPWFLELGNNCWIGEHVWIDNLVKVKIGSDVCLSQGSFLLTGNHDYKSSRFDLITEEIILEDGVWIGAKAIVGPGVTCFSHSILVAGSATFHNLDSFFIYQGNPAKLKRKRELSGVYKTV